ncbi:conserved hypothetical protein [Vibrio cholerae O1 str. 2010EL-1786]|uniref:Uncharacterized protein n=2 Tax=Vibrio cholerae TaxID=666 RepID=Q9KTA7_VIBCH|nr:hypothetical protein VC_0996 [Vibrio cholerae O1 biovar El Tor str. N16961]ACP05270.1 conserved hypothetical protein [Vibrio cholerae M66-2]ACP09023.1 conserved hypothetical protein [Vibrio cholerae O395]ACQ61502.1 hypothetical protein VCD_003342 [Vibrio cholerae MJ-1236]AET26110.1 conserved hypothetical protein [Vibrio cholerae O1 str. 2010EL-1786]EEN99170.1 hypothetical protein VCG_003014 [Vibrio cholerae 12129(1)]EEO04207.1 hypothetical protein VCA_003243 [Vibrio cholerae VL426]EEO0459
MCPPQELWMISGNIFCFLALMVQEAETLSDNTK